MADLQLYKDVIGGLVKNPSSLSNFPKQLEPEDFDDDTTAKLVFITVVNLIAEKNQIITSRMIYDYLTDKDKLTPSNKGSVQNFVGEIFASVDGEESEALSSNLAANYEKLKKRTMVRALRKRGFSLGKYDTEVSNLEKQTKAKELLSTTSSEEILKNISGELEQIRSKYVFGQENHSIYAAEGLADLIASFKEKPDVGPALCGEYYNSIVGGARKGMMYLRSSLSNVGKTRFSVFDACNLAFPIKYNNAEKTFKYSPEKIPQKVLFITTEMQATEIQSIIVAYLSGVEEHYIKRGALTPEEEFRVQQAIRIANVYSEYFILDYIENPGLDNVESIIKKHALVDDVDYVFYDYIFTSPALIQQFSHSGIREDVALGMLSTKLKEIAVNYNVFLATSTQLNGDGFKLGEKRDQRMLRGSKAVADKVDVGAIISKVLPEELEQIQPYIREFGAPTHVMDVYKLRSGVHKNDRIWFRANLGTGERKDLFVTDENNDLVIFHPQEVITQPKEYNCEISEEFLKYLLNEEEKRKSE